MGKRRHDEFSVVAARKVGDSSFGELRSCVNLTFQHNIQKASGRKRTIILAIFTHSSLADKKQVVPRYRPWYVFKRGGFCRTPPKM